MIGAALGAGSPVASRVVKGALHIVSIRTYVKRQQCVSCVCGRAPWNQRFHEKVYEGRNQLHPIGHGSYQQKLHRGTHPSAQLSSSCRW